MNDDLIRLVKALVIDDPATRDSIFKQIEEAQHAMDVLMEPEKEEEIEEIYEISDDLEAVSNY